MIKANEDIGVMNQPIAVVGMALRAPGAYTLEEFWDNLQRKEDCLRRMSRFELEQAALSSSHLTDPAIVHAKPMVDDLAYFDANFFGISDSMAKQMNPTHRFFLECCWEAMENAGMKPGDKDQTTGVFVGGEFEDISYLANHLNTDDANMSDGFAMQLGNFPDYLALRVSYELDLKGPSMVSNATCATSLIAVQQAVQNLRSGVCDAAFAGGARVEFPAVPYYATGIQGMRSTSGQVRPFDAAADGTVFGNGVGVVLLKRLSDAVRDGNPIHAVIRGVGLSNDGRPEEKQSFVAPTVSGQKQAIRQALKDSGCSPESIGYVECHGTATEIGDPIELRSLTEVFRESSDSIGHCTVGAVKGHIGHLGAAAGIAGLIKACLVVSKGRFPALANFEEPNPKIDLSNSPFVIEAESRPWEANGLPRRAGVSSFGFGGANAHLILEEYVAPVEETALESDFERPLQLLPFSAKSQAALERRLVDAASFCEKYPNASVESIARTLQNGRVAMPFRSCLVSSSKTGAELVGQVRELKASRRPTRSNRPVVFLFPGQGSQMPNMGKELYENQPFYRGIVDRCAEILVGEIGFDIRKKMFLQEGQTFEEAKKELSQTFIAQPALFVVEYALSKLLERWGLRPTAMLGHSLGELVAACLAGVYSLETGLKLVALRGQLMQKCQPGSMLAVFLSLEELEPIMPGNLDLAAINSPTSTVVAGPDSAISEFAEQLEASGIGNRLLATSHAYHSRMLDSTREEFRTELRNFDFHPPVGCSISNVSGLPITEVQARDPNYWVEQRQNPVRFSEGLGNFPAEDFPIFIEVGPGRVLSRFVAQHDSGFDTITCLNEGAGDVSVGAAAVLETLGKVWMLGGEIDWNTAAAENSVPMLRMPVYPFQRKFYWTDRNATTEETDASYPLALYEPGWSKAEFNEKPVFEQENQWLVFADAWGVAEQVIDQVVGSEERCVKVEMGDRYERITSSHYRIRPASSDDFQNLLRQIDFDTDRPLRALHFWNLGQGEKLDLEIDVFQDACSRGFHTLTKLVQSAHGCQLSSQLTVQIYADGVSQVDQLNESLRPENGCLLGPCLVASQEIPGLAMRCIDLPVPPAGGYASDLLERIVDECRFDDTSTLTAIRNESRYVEQLFDLTEIPKGTSRLRSGGTVVITGGVGGLGICIAEKLFDSSRARLVLTSRWSPPPREEWPEYATRDDKIGRAIQRISRLVDRGAEVHIVQADVCNREDLRRVDAEARARFGAVHGIVHAAGILDDGPVLHKTVESADKVFMAKVGSAYLLEEIYGDQYLDMFVHFSSQASSQPNKGQVDYSAANAVLDRLARRRSQAGRGLACAIGWGAWRDAGMAWSYQGTELALASLFDQKPDSQPPLDSIRDVTHSLLEKKGAYPNGSVLFSGKMAIDSHWVGTEHVVNQDRSQGIVSATSIYEMVRAAYSEIDPAAPGIGLNGVVLLSPFVVGTETDYELIFVPFRESYRVELRSKHDGEKNGWTINFKAEIKTIESSPTVASEILEKFEALKKQSLEPSRKFDWAGPRWHCDWVAQSDEDSIATRVRLPDKYLEELNEYVLHPALLDRSIHNAMDHLVGPLIPFSCDACRIYGRLPAETFTFATRVEGELSNGCNLVIADSSGNVLVEFDNYSLRASDDGWGGFGAIDDEKKDHSMVVGKIGALNSFESRDLYNLPIKPAEVRLSIAATGLNFRDVLCALGQMPNAEVERLKLGMECSGIVEEVGSKVQDFKVGDRVVAISNSCFATSALVDSNAVSFLPESLTFVEGASIPITFLTCEYALNQLAKLEAGERVLIHAATGGVGLAAIQIAKRIGAEIFATAGSDKKRAYLRGLGIEHVMDSRTHDFVEEIIGITEGEGVDVVLNSLAGDFIAANFSVLKPFGRFLELGKRDMFEHTEIDLFPFRNNLSYFGVDLGQMMKFRPEKFHDMFGRMMLDFATGRYRPCPVTPFSLADIGKGFEHMARAKHIGKIVITTEHPANAVDDELNHFRARFGAGISLVDGLEVFERLVRSDETPANVVASAEALNVNGLVEKHQADQIAVRPVDTPYREATRENEITLKQVWEKTLGVEPVGIDDDFIELGGDSISAIIIQTFVEESLGINLPLTALFRNTTIAKICDQIDKGLVKVS
ncbi:MAG: SDR family NAD(P)-dependent oxidoreductase [Planctomycetaceae bacterium]|nr:SDR family NAD(P)-dependent oxidoreductase [Planctomycetaceae bacterium]